MYFCLDNAKNQKDVGDIIDTLSMRLYEQLLPFVCYNSFKFKLCLFWTDKDERDCTKKAVITKPAGSSELFIIKLFIPLINSVV